VVVVRNSLTLLYVEDDKDTRESLSEVLCSLVANVYVAKDGAEAFEIYKTQHVDFVISDFQMPNMNGNELCSAIKEINGDTHFVLLTAYNDTTLLTNAINAGVDRFLLKPINAKQLFSVVDEIKNKLFQKFQLDLACTYLHDAEKIANLFYWDYNLETKVMNFQTEALELFDLEQDMKDKLDYKLLSSMVIDEDKSKFLYIFERKIFEKDVIDEVIIIKNKKHEQKYLRIATSKWKSSVYGDMYVVGMFQDISRYEEQRLAILKYSQSDPVLHVDNKKTITLKLDNLIKSSIRYGHPVAALFFDIDDFKSINDNNGHLVADDILVELVELIKTNIRQSDNFGRWGGDEFIIITAHSSPDEDIKLAQKILKKVKENQWSNNINLTVSIGISFYEVGDDALSLINRADFEMLEAKKDGKNSYKY